MTSKILKLTSSLLGMTLLLGCTIEPSQVSAGADVPLEASAYLDCEGTLRDVKALSEKMEPAERYRLIERAILEGCSSHQGLIEERFVLSAVDGVGAPPADLLTGLDWRRSTDSTFWWAFTSEAIDGNLPGIDVEDVLRRYEEAFAYDFLPHLLKAQWHQDRDDFPAVEREVEIATELLGGKHSTLFLMERAYLAKIYLLEGRTQEAYEMSRHFVPLNGDEAWLSPGMVGIAALAAVRSGRPQEGKALLDELLRRDPSAAERVSVKMAMSELNQ